MSRSENETSPIYAHTLPNTPPTCWETLDVHAGDVARLARSYASAFNAGGWGELLGGWHDLGKVQPEFQDYINGRAAIGPPHAWVGAVHALTQDGRLMLPVAAAIAAHHGALANVKGDEASGVSVVGSLAEMVRQRRAGKCLAELSDGLAQ